MKTFVWIKVLFIVVLFSLSCSRQVIRQSVREIDRPLFLPQKNFQTSIGMEFGRVMREKGYNKDTTWRYLGSEGETFNNLIFDIQWPSLHIGEKIEFYLPFILRAYLMKNVIVEDSIERINGTNIALVNGMSAIVFSGETFKLMNLHSSLFIKKPLSNSIWLESHSGFHFDLQLNSRIKHEFNCYLEIPVAFGFQLTDRFSAKSSIFLLGAYDYYETDPNGENYSKGWHYSRTVYDLDIRVPLEFKYVFNHNWEITALGTGYVYSKKNIYISGASWLTLTW
jgi:hypothetical protein